MEGVPIIVTATAGNTGPTIYARLELAFTAINTGVHQGDINVAITGNTTETGSANLVASGVGGADYTSVLMRPSGGAPRTISGSIGVNSSLINLTVPTTSPSMGSTLAAIR